MKKINDRETVITYKEFKEAFYGEGIITKDKDKVINYLWTLRLGNHAFSDNFKTKEELIQTIRDFKEFLLQLLYGVSH